MKRLIAFVLALLLAFSLSGCGESKEKKAKEEERKRAFELAKKAFSEIESAYDITQTFGSDVYEAWRLGIYDDEEIMKDGVKYLAKELSLSEAELKDGLVAAIYEITGEKWEDTSEADKDQYRKNSALVFQLMEDSLFSFCVSVVTNSYLRNGKTEIVQNALAAAKTDMKEMSEKYSDYEHYSSLKGYYTTTNAFFEFCNDPTGSFSQVGDTLNRYRNDAREYRNDLSYIFED